MNGIVQGLDEATYHAHPALSSTGARKLLVAPARFAYDRLHPAAPKKEFDIGTAAHSRVLGVGAGVVAIPADLLASNGALSTKAAKDWVEKQRDAGLVPIKEREFEQVNAMAESVLAHPAARSVLEQDGIAEASVFGVDPVTGVETRARFDFLGRGDGQRVGVDLKTAHDSVSPVKFAKTIADHSYHVQEAHYTDTLEFAGESIDRFVFVAVEKTPPYLVAVYVLDDDYREIGRARAARARELFAAGLATGHWPGHSPDIQIARPPAWAVYDHIDAQETDR